MTSKEPIPGRCNAQTRDGKHCENYPVDGNARCRMHGGSSLAGSDHPNYEHGAYSKHLRTGFTDREKAAVDELVELLDDDEGRNQAAREAAAEAVVKYKRVGDPRFLREFRQICKTFGLTPDDRIEVEHSGSVDHEHEHEVPDHVVEAMIGAAESNLEGGDQ